MSESAEVLERRIGGLRVAVREAVLAGDRELARTLRADLKHAEQDWEDALVKAKGAQAADALQEPGSAIQRSVPLLPLRVPLLPLREQVHQALSLLTVPAAPRLIATVHEAFFAATFPSARLTSITGTKSVRSGPRRSPAPTTSAPR